MKLRVAIFQMDIVWGDCNQNLQRVEEFVRSVEADLVVLPEMFLTGYNCSAEVAMPTNSPYIARLQSLADESGRAVMGSVAVSEGGAIFNRLYLFAPDAAPQFYDKRHLFGMAGEGKVFSAGEERVVMEYRGWRILPLVCYDLRFPVWSRQRGDEYDLIVYSAEWASSRISSWSRLLPARAIENLAYVVGVNRVGDDPSAHYSGGSVVLSPLGDVVASVADDEEGGAVACLDMEVVERLRSRFPALADADKFEII